MTHYIEITVSLFLLLFSGALSAKIYSQLIANAERLSQTRDDELNLTRCVAHQALMQNFTTAASYLKKEFPKKADEIEIAFDTSLAELNQRADCEFAAFTVARATITTQIKRSNTQDLDPLWPNFQVH